MMTSGDRDSLDHWSDQCGRRGLTPDLGARAKADRLESVPALHPQNRAPGPCTFVASDTG
jgi:hypothetical protein